jgi:hypothetical protein
MTRYGWRKEEQRKALQRSKPDEERKVLRP